MSASGSRCRALARGGTLDALVAANEARFSRERLALILVFEALRGLGYDDEYDAVQRYARSWGRERAPVEVRPFRISEPLGDWLKPPSKL